MPTQRPFLSNFLAAFRLHSIPKAQPSLATSGVVAAATQQQTLWTSAAASNPASKPTQQQSPSPSPSLEQQTTATLSNPKPINPKSNPYASQASTSHALQHNVSPQTHLPRSPSTPGLPVYGPPNKPAPQYPTAAESRRATRRRGSDSSSDSGGFREVRGAGGGAEQWFIGGRTAGGEEKYYKLSMVRRERSADRISADQLSL